MDDFFRALDFHEIFFENVALAQRFGPVLKSMISGAQKGNELLRKFSKNKFQNVDLVSKETLGFILVRKCCSRT